jgi:hypothetical protein
MSSEDKMRLRNKARDLIINSKTMNRIDKTTRYHNEAKNIDTSAKLEFHTKQEPLPIYARQKNSFFMKIP